MTIHGYTGEEKARIRQGFQCPACFGTRVAPQHHGMFDAWRYQCIECGEQWRADAPQFQSASGG